MGLGGAVLATVVLVAGGNGSALAQTPDCTAPMDQISINQCAAADWQAQDARLNALWPRAMAWMKLMDQDLPAGQPLAQDALRGGQRAWIAYRDQTCAAEGYQMRGGSGEAMLIYGCLARLTRARADDLQAMVDMGG